MTFYDVEIRSQNFSGTAKGMDNTIKALDVLHSSKQRLQCATDCNLSHPEAADYTYEYHWVLVPEELFQMLAQTVKFKWSPQRKSTPIWDATVCVCVTSF